MHKQLLLLLALCTTVGLWLHLSSTQSKRTGIHNQQLQTDQAAVAAATYFQQEKRGNSRVSLGIPSGWIGNSLIIGSLLGLVILTGAFLFNRFQKLQNRPADPGSQSADIKPDPVDNTPPPSTKEEDVEPPEMTESMPEEVSDPVKQMIHKHYRNPDLTIDKLAALLNTSRSSLYRSWDKHHRMKISDYIQELRLKQAIYLIDEQKYSITEAAELSGFSSQSYFSKVFKKRYGQTPSSYLFDK